MYGTSILHSTPRWGAPGAGAERVTQELKLLAHVFVFTFVHYRRAAVLFAYERIVKAWVVIRSNQRTQPQVVVGAARQDKTADPSLGGLCGLHTTITSGVG